MIGSYYIVGGTASTFFTLRSVTATSTIATSTLTAANEAWWYEPIPAPHIERKVRGDARRPWSASDVAGRLPVVVELRASRRVPAQLSPRSTPRRPTWAAALRAFHRDPGGLSREPG